MCPLRNKFCSLQTPKGRKETFSDPSELQKLNEIIFRSPEGRKTLEISNTVIPRVMKSHGVMKREKIFLVYCQVKYIVENQSQFIDVEKAKFKVSVPGAACSRKYDTFTS